MTRRRSILSHHRGVRRWRESRPLRRIVAALALRSWRSRHRCQRGRLGGRRRRRRRRAVAQAARGETCAPFPAPTRDFSSAGSCELDGLATRNKQTGAEQDTFLVSATPFGPADSDQRLSDAPVAGQLAVRHADRARRRSRRARAGEPVLARSRRHDQAVAAAARTRNSPTRSSPARRIRTFVDPDVLPTTLDYNGPSGATAVQQWLARAIDPVGRRMDDRGRRRGFAGGPSCRPRAVRASHAARAGPDLAAHLRFDFERGHVQLAALSRSIDADRDGGLDTTERDDRRERRRRSRARSRPSATIRSSRSTRRARASDATSTIR